MWIIWLFYVNQWYMFCNLGCWNCDQGIYDLYLYTIVLFLLLIQWVFDFVNNFNHDSIVLYYFESHSWCSCHLFHLELFV